MLRIETYQQHTARNRFESDPALAERLEDLIPEALRPWARERLARFGARGAEGWDALAERANRESPTLAVRTAWGEFRSTVTVSAAYEALAQEAYELGVVWPRFRGVPEHGGLKAPWAAVLAFGYLLAQSEQGLFCPVCLTAGTAWILERFAPPDLRERVLSRVASADYAALWEGAMFLTELAGGSDVGRVETIARQDETGAWRLSGEKWFASNAGRAKAMLVLARPEGAPEGTRGLGLFLVEAETPDGRPNAIRLHRMKDKLGTRSMPSAELAFEGAVATLLGGPGRGFGMMAEMLNLSRVYNTLASLALLRRVLGTAAAYGAARTVFGRRVIDHAMVREQASRWLVEQEAGVEALFEVVGMLDRVEAGAGTPEDEALVRFLTPILKHHTARQAVDGASWAAEALGGNGYIEDWPIARFFRDAQVLPIWEGTTNVLVLDTWRAIAKHGALPAFVGRLGRAIAEAAPGRRAPLQAALDAFERDAAALTALPSPERELALKGVGDRALRLFQAVLLEKRARGGSARAVLRWELFADAHLIPADGLADAARRARKAAESYGPLYEPLLGEDAAERQPAPEPVRA